MNTPNLVLATWDSKKENFVSLLMQCSLVPQLLVDVQFSPLITLLVGVNSISCHSKYFHTLRSYTHEFTLLFSFSFFLFFFFFCLLRILWFIYIRLIVFCTTLTHLFQKLKKIYIIDRTCGVKLYNNQNSIGFSLNFDFNFIYINIYIYIYIVIDEFYSHSLCLISCFSFFLDIHYTHEFTFLFFFS